MQEQIEGLREALREYTEVMKRSNPGMNGGSNANINVQGLGGVGLWTAVTCAVLSTVLCIGMLILGCAVYLAQESKISELNSKVSKGQDYLNAIYAVAPQLKPKEEKK